MNEPHLAVAGDVPHHLDVETTLLARMIGETAVIEIETGTMTTAVALAVQSTAIVTVTATRRMIVIVETMIEKMPMAKIEKVRLPTPFHISRLTDSISCGNPTSCT